MGSAKVVVWPLASQILGCMMMVASSPATSSRRWVIERHQ